MARWKTFRAVLFIMAVSCATPLVSVPATWASPHQHAPLPDPLPDPLSASQRQSWQAGLQISPKGASTSKRSAAAPSRLRLPNPYLAEIADPRTVDYSGWAKKLAAAARERSAGARLRVAQATVTGHAPPAPLEYHEREAANRRGANDTQRTAQHLHGFGTGAHRNPRAQVLGELADTSLKPVPLAPGGEDNGQLDRASRSSIRGSGAVQTTGVLGDGPYGSAGTGSDDFDFYRLRATKGFMITIDTSGSSADTVVGLYDAAGTLLGVDDDDGSTAGSSRLAVRAPNTGTFYALVAGYSELGSLPADPHDSGSGAGGAAEGDYQLTLSSAPVDTDFYAVDLAKGDVVGATVTGSANALTVFRPDGQQRVGADRIDLTSLYPAESPLPGGGNTTLAYVAERSGRYAIRVDGPAGAYDATIEVYRPGSEVDRSARPQTVFLDFRGGSVDTSAWGGPGPATLSPLSSFMGRWGLTRSQQRVLISRITRNVRENLQHDLVAKGLNPHVTVRVVNSLAYPKGVGETNVSRVVVAGSISESGLSTIGLSQDIDPGNYAHEDSALILLDSISSPCDATGVSFNCYLSGSSNRVRFVSQALSNLISHEVGHLVGNFHTDGSDAKHSLMDHGGPYADLYGVGRDGVGGTRDDEDVDFVTDAYLPSEGFTGKENTLNVAAWGFARRARACYR